MKVFIPIICIMSMALAEPPIGDGYPSARSRHDHSRDHNHEHSNDFKRSLSQKYGPPAARALDPNTVSREYLPPNARTTNSRSSLSQTYGVPNTRTGTSQNAVTSRSSARSQNSRGLSTESRAPSARSGPSQTYGAPAARSGLSQEYGVPSVQPSSVSTKFGVPEARMPLEEYGAPSQRSFGDAPSETYGPPAARNSQSSARAGVSNHSNLRSATKSFGITSARSSKLPSAFRPRSSNNRTPKARSNSRNIEALSQTYGAPSQLDRSDTIVVASVRSFSPKSVVPASRSANKMTSAVVSPFSAFARSAPSDTYGAPSARGSMPSEQYGVPEQYSSRASEGYPAARNGLNDDDNEEPASYDFGYKVSDYESGSDFGHAETRQDNRAEGSYFVVLPDGTKQTVEYEADERGFRPRISVEPADSEDAAGYDDNAAELARSNDGPY